MTSLEAKQASKAASQEALKTIIVIGCDDTKQPLVLLHADSVGKRDYTEGELDCLKDRDFESRLLITGMNIEGRTVRLRTHHTDDHKYSSHLNYVRDYFKAAHATKNNTAAKATLTDLLTMFFSCDRSYYYSFALTLASGLSKQGENTSFEINDSMVKDEKLISQARKEFCLHMDVLFENVWLEKFLVSDEGANTFRLVYCQTKHTKDKRPYILAFISFLIQLFLTGYVLIGVAEFFISLDPADEGPEIYNLIKRNMPLAILTFLYSTIIAYSIVSESSDAYRLYKKMGILYVMDFTVNSIIPLVLLFAGFFVILIQESFFDCVLNTAALLFIPEIDDQLPRLLGLKDDVIVHNHLVSEAVMQYGAVMRQLTTTKIPMQVKDSIGVQFNDFYITNIPEQGSNPRHGELFQPYQVRPAVDGDDYQIVPSLYVTEHCLIRRMEWSYTTYLPMTTKPRVGYLKLEKMNGEIVEIEQKGADNETSGVNHKRYSLEGGAFIITTFQMSNTIIKLRVCGSYVAEDFLKAFEYYSLWDISPGARSLIRKKKEGTI